MKEELAQKYERLQEKISSYVPEGIMVAFSGGVDSALLLKMACMAAGKENMVFAVTVQTKLHPAGDLETAERTAKEFGAVHKVLQIDELTEFGIENNPVNRCYLCKRGIFRRIKDLADELGVGCILEGTNADDLHQYRPGIRALRELQIRSPLCECALTKAEIRELAESLGISVAKRPSAPCLATRLPYGTIISYDLLAKIDEGERYLRELGFYNVRLRAHALTKTVNANTEHEAGVFWHQQTKKNAARISDRIQTDRITIEKKEETVWLVRIEVDLEDLPKLLGCREELVKKIKILGFDRVTVDLEGFRSGSMDSVRWPDYI